VLQRWAAQRSRPRPALIEHDQLIAGKCRTKPRDHAREERHSGETRPANDEQQYPMFSVADLLDGYCQAQPPACLAGVIERHRQPRARESGGLLTGMSIGQPLRHAC
jgi:hypothetical protein